MSLSLIDALLDNFLSHLENGTSKYYFDDSVNPNFQAGFYARYSDDHLTTVTAFYVPTSDYTLVEEQLPVYYLWLHEGTVIRMQGIRSPSLLAYFADDATLQDCYVKLTTYLKDSNNNQYITEDYLPRLSKVVPQLPVRTYDFLPTVVLESEDSFNRALVLSDVLFYTLIDTANTIAHRIIVEEGTLNSYSFSDFDYSSHSFKLNLDITWDNDAMQPSIKWYMQWMTPPSDSQLSTSYYIEVSLGQDNFTPGEEEYYVIPFRFEKPT